MTLYGSVNEKTQLSTRLRGVSRTELTGYVGTKQWPSREPLKSDKDIFKRIITSQLLIDRIINRFFKPPDGAVEFVSVEVVQLSKCI